MGTELRGLSWHRVPNLFLAPWVLDKRMTQGAGDYFNFIKSWKCCSRCCYSTRVIRHYSLFGNSKRLKLTLRSRWKVRVKNTRSVTFDRRGEKQKSQRGTTKPSVSLLSVQECSFTSSLQFTAGRLQALFIYYLPLTGWRQKQQQQQVWWRI